MQAAHKPRVRTAKRDAATVDVSVYRVPKTKTRKPKALMKFCAGWTPSGYSVDAPCITQTESNANEHWRTRHGRAKAQRTVAVYALELLPHSYMRNRIRTIRFVRFAPGELDCDNLPGALKHIRDQVCAWIAGENNITGEGDDSPSCGIRFEYAQCKQREYGVRVEMSFGSYELQSTVDLMKGYGQGT